MCKDLAYSQKQLEGFLLQMQGIRKLDATMYTCEEVCIELKSQEEGRGENEALALCSLPRCYMYLKGPKEQLEAFYKKFMLYHMTMGG